MWCPHSRTNSNFAGFITRRFVAGFFPWSLGRGGEIGGRIRRSPSPVSSPHGEDIPWAVFGFEWVAICDVRFTSRQCGRNIQHSTFNTQRPRSEGARRVWPWGNASCLVGWRLAKSARGLDAVQDAPRGRGTGGRGVYGGVLAGGTRSVVAARRLSFLMTDPALQCRAAFRLCLWHGRG